MLGPCQVQIHVQLCMLRRSYAGPVTGIIIMADFSHNQNGSTIETLAKESCSNIEKDDTSKEELMFSQSDAQISDCQFIEEDETENFSFTDKRLDAHETVPAKSKDLSVTSFEDEAMSCLNQEKLGFAETGSDSPQHTEQCRGPLNALAFPLEHEKQNRRNIGIGEVDLDALNRYGDNLTTSHEEHDTRLGNILMSQSIPFVNASGYKQLRTSGVVKEDASVQNKHVGEADTNDIHYGGSGSDQIDVYHADSKGVDEVTQQQKFTIASSSEVHRLSNPCSVGCTKTYLRNSQCNVSLRQWISYPNRVIDRVENLHIFKQISEFVELAHSQGVVLRNIRPSSFLLSPLSRVSIIDSASTYTSSGTSEQSTGRAAVPVSVSDVYRTETGLGDSPKPSNIAESSPTNQQISIYSEADQEKLLVTRPESSNTPGTGCAEHETNENRPPGGICVVTSVRAIGNLNLPNDSNRSDSQKGKVRSETASSGDKDSVGYKEIRSNKFQSCSSDERAQPQDEKFPLKKILSMEETWYKSPEELSGGAATFSSDVYCLGMLFFELFCSSGSEVEWSRAMSDLRHRFLPPRLLLEYPKEALFCLWLLHPDSSSRPEAREILHADIFSEVGDQLAEREAVMNLEEKELETEITLDFLLQMQQEKQEIFQKLSLDIVSIKTDIEEVERRWSVPKKCDMLTKRFKNSAPESVNNLETSKMDTRRQGFLGKQPGQGDEFQGSIDSRHHLPERKEELLLAKSAQLKKNFNNFKQIYGNSKQKTSQSGISNDNFRQSCRGLKTGAKKQESFKHSDSFNGQKSKGANAGDRLGCFFDNMCKFFCYSRFDVKATLQHGDLLNTGNMVCSLSFDCDDEFFATAGLCKRIKVFEYSSVLEESFDIHYPVIEMASRTKLSCVCWNYYSKSHLASSDIEGAVQLWDVTRGQSFMEFKEHGRRVWSVDFSHSDPSKLASGSDDCCVKLWSMKQVASIGTIRTKANVCSVQFPPDSSHLLIYGGADHKVYCHDLRYMRVPICELSGHSKAVSSVRYVDSLNIISASTDNSLKLWDLTKRTKSSNTGSRNACGMTFTGHRNEKNFVGLSVAEGGYIACGSETNEVFVYHKSLPMPMLLHKFGTADPISGQEVEDAWGQFVSCLCWRGKSQTLVAANSLGNIKVLEMV